MVQQHLLDLLSPAFGGTAPLAPADGATGLAQPVRLRTLPLTPTQCAWKARSHAPSQTQDDEALLVSESSPPSQITHGSHLGIAFGTFSPRAGERARKVESVVRASSLTTECGAGTVTLTQARDAVVPPVKRAGSRSHQLTGTEFLPRE